MRRPVAAIALLLGLGACQAAPPRPEATVAAPPAPAAAPRFEAVPGKWVAAKAANLRAGPGTDFPIVGGVRPGDPLDVLGRPPGTEWLALRQGNSQVFIHKRLTHQTDEPPPVTQRVVVAMPAPIRQAAPAPAADAPAPVPATVPASTPVAAPAAAAGAPAGAPVALAGGRTQTGAAPRGVGDWVATGDPVPLRPIAR
ncbi:SH3 domain-containing protein [Skermanella mucosa]|uniref:SH3 domain-containing protein n=1 Tax=Skermanella mucosa TaxID=1789672 RepID=UPI00192CD5D8|nr:SH3 domain-containing protein [Skermanella mucosa]UEM22065.1 SH3 domain-containing protein [Skermanella mucosa]